MHTPVAKKPRLLDSTLRPDLINDETLNCIKSAWNSSSDLKKNGIEIITDPFPVCIVQNFINNPELLKSAAGELSDVTFHQKSNDLYEFKQSDDVRNLTDFTFIPRLYDLIRVDGRRWVSDILERSKLGEDISATFSSYGYKDRLLCHDDKCEDRHIAFILYLTEGWNESDGGCLELFKTDSNGCPSDIVKSITPQFNTLIFFKVTSTSFHQVSEVKSKTKTRLSINGWFHSSGKKLKKASCLVLENPQAFANDNDYNLEEYFLFIYFETTNKMDINKVFSTESEIQLDEFIVPKFLEQIEAELKSEGLKWIAKGPANIRKYELANESDFPPSLQTLKGIFESKSWFKYLKSVTGLDLSPSATSDLEKWERGRKPTCNFEIQRWTHSCYTLIHDKNPEFHSEALDVILRLPIEATEDGQPAESDAPEGGHIIYIDSTSKDEECLLHIGYKMNSLGLIFRDDKTLRFTKYLDCTSKPFYQILCTYRPWKPPLDDPGLKHCEMDDSEDSLNEDEDDDYS